MRFAIAIPQYARGSRFDDGAFRAHLRRVEEFGLFESGWVQDNRRGRRRRRSTLTYAAACTERCDWDKAADPAGGKHAHGHTTDRIDRASASFPLGLPPPIWTE